MRHRRRDHSAPAAVGLIDEAVQLLRNAPGGLLAVYCVGSVPFLLGLLFFWAEMSRGAYAHRHVVPAALGMALLYLWMKSWQAVFSRELLARRSGLPPVKWTRAGLVQLLLRQGALQPTLFVVLPVAALVMLPFGWVYAFYHNLSVLDDGQQEPIGALLRRAWSQASLWANQNHLVLLLLFVFAVFVFLNLYTALLLFPWLVKMLLGVESVFTRSPLAYVNSTVLAAVCALTYLAVNPLVKAVYVLRCFYGQARRSGADLRAELKALPLVLALLVCGAAAAPASEPAAAPPPPGSASTGTSVDQARLDQAVGDVLSRPEYSWRLPREKQPLDERGFVGQVLAATFRMLRNWKNAVAEWVDGLIRWIRRQFGHWDPNAGDRSPPNWTERLHALVFLLVAVAVVLLGVLLWRSWRTRRRGPPLTLSTPSAAVPDLRDEGVLATQLPTDGWLQQAARLMAQGDLRLALRALFLAGLAHLGQQELLAIQRFKSNQDYQRELQRRAHSWPVVLEAFGANVLSFERAWYGMHEVTREQLEQFQANLQRIREAV